MGATLIRTGAIGSAHAMKALNNYVYAAGLLAVSEALAIAERMELDPGIFADVLNASSGRNVASETKLKQFIIPRDFAGGFALALQAKDIATAAKLQGVTGVDGRLLRLCDSVWKEAVDEAEPGADNTSIYRHVARRPAATRSLKRTARRQSEIDHVAHRHSQAQPDRRDDLSRGRAGPGEAAQARRREAVIANPCAGRYEPDLMPFMAELRSLGTLLATELVETLGGKENIEVYSKAAIVGIDGEMEHGAVWHEAGGWAMRTVRRAQGDGSGRHKPWPRPAIA